MAPPNDTPDRPSDPVEGLRDRLRQAEEAASRIAGGGSGKIPPRGWDVPRPGGTDPDESPEIRALVALFEALRELVPADVRQQVAEAFAELLRALRALIDWYLERFPRQPREPVEVHEIPID